MSRQLRRHPAAAKPTKQRQIRPTLRGPGPVAPGRDAGKRTLSSTMRPGWVQDVLSELRKVQWPTRQEAWNLTLVVIIVCVAFGVSLGVLDYVFSWLIQHTVLR